ncbi:MAG TPA: hypothetical protein VHM65_04770, partial [Candidatus Lustribacter sp.]|nr:hypothetical protein [Candidatus Lustribacter sp.]
LGAVLSIGGMFTRWLEPVVGAHPEGEPPVLAVPLITGLTLALIAGGVVVAWVSYGRAVVPATAPAGSLLTRAARQDLYQDQVNEGLFMRPGIHLTRSLVFVDNRGVDGAAGGLAAFVGGLSSRLRKVQNGYVRSYALTMLTGVVVILGAMWVIR